MYFFGFPKICNILLLLSLLLYLICCFSRAFSGLQINTDILSFASEIEKQQMWKLGIDRSHLDWLFGRDIYIVKLSLKITRKSPFRRFWSELPQQLVSKQICFESCIVGYPRLMLAFLLRIFHVAKWLESKWTRGWKALGYESWDMRNIALLTAWMFVLQGHKQSIALEIKYWGICMEYFDIHGNAVVGGAVY